MAGPAFGLNARLNFDLKFKDYEELKNHPMADNFVLTLDQIFKKFTDRDLKDLREGKFDLSEFDDEKIQALVDKEEIPKEAVETVKSFDALLTIMEELDPVTKADVDVYMNDMISING